MHTKRLYSDAYIAHILNQVNTIALVGASPRCDRDSHICMRFLLDHGYKVIPVNPQEVGNFILDQRCYARLTDIPEKIDMVEIFRSSEATFDVTLEALDSDIDVIWMQLGVINEQAEALAKAHGIDVIMDRCPKLELEKFQK